MGKGSGNAKCKNSVRCQSSGRETRGNQLGEYDLPSVNEENFNHAAIKKWYFFAAPESKCESIEPF